MKISTYLGSALGSILWSVVSLRHSHAHQTEGQGLCRNADEFGYHCRRSHCSQTSLTRVSTHHELYKDIIGEIISILLYNFHNSPKAAT